MINYNIVMLGNPAKTEEPKKAYSVAQYTEKMTLDKLSEHISEHNSVYDAEDVQAILGKAVKCRELGEKMGVKCFPQHKGTGW